MLFDGVLNIEDFHGCEACLLHKISVGFINMVANARSVLNSSDQRAACCVYRRSNCH